MRTAIFGAGSLGIVLGAYLTKAGIDVTLVHRRQSMVDALRENGATVTGGVHMNVPVKACLPREMGGVYDIVFLATKQQDNPRSAAFLAPMLGSEGVLVTLQNGLPEEALGKVLGANRVIGCTVAWGATLESDGVSRLTSSPSSMSFGMGPADGKWTRACGNVKKVLETMCPVQVVPDLRATRWSKLLINAAFSGMGTVIGGTFGEVAADETAKALCLAVINECIETGQALGIPFAKVQGKDAVRLMYTPTPLRKFIALEILPLAIRKHAMIEPSMLQDLKKGRTCEVDAINGALSAAGKQAGVPTPVNDRIIEIIHRFESGELSPGKENLKLFEDLPR